MSGPRWYKSLKINIICSFNDFKLICCVFFFLSFFGGSYFDQVAETTVPLSALNERSDSLKVNN